MKKRIMRVLLVLVLLALILPVTVFAETETISKSGVLYTNSNGVSEGDVFTFTIPEATKVHITYQNTTPHTSFDLRVKESGKWKDIAPYDGISCHFPGSDYYYGIDRFYQLEAGTYTVSIYVADMYHTSSAWIATVKYTIHTHSYTDHTKTYDPTCSREGYTRYYCECGDYKTRDYVDKLPHTEASRGKEAPTCTKTGLTAGVVCSVCDKVFSGRETIPMIEHTYKNNQCTGCGRKIGTCGTALEWALESDGKLTITGTGAMTDFSKGGAPWYADREKIKSVTLPDGMTTLGSYAFEGIAGVTEIKVPGTVTSIGAGAFSGCAKVKKVTIPTGMTAIGDETFSGCAALTGITIPEGVTSIGASAFAGCSGLTKLTLPEGLTTLGAHTFENCTGLQEVKLPEGITALSDYLFSGCTGLTSFTFPKGTTAIGDHALAGCTGITKLTIPDTVTAIGKQAFSGCTGLTELLFRCAAPTLGAGAFKGITATIHYRESLPGWDAVVTQGYGGSITWNEEHTYTSRVTEYTCTEKGYTTHTCACGEQYVDSYTDPAHRISSGMCTKCYKAGTCGDEVTWEFDESTGTLTISGTGEMKNYKKDSKGSYWINYKEKITSVVVEEGVTSIGEYAFYSDWGEKRPLKAVTLPSTLTKIGKYAFYDCWQLHKIDLPAGLTYIGSYAFAESGIEECILPEGITKINEGVFSDSYLEKITFSSTLTEIDEKAFYNTNSLKRIEIPASVKRIRNRAFASSGLEEVIISTPSTWSGLEVFADCTKLKKATISCKRTFDYMFDGCTSLTDVVLTDTVETIAAGTFHGCTALTEITLPNSVKEIKKTTEVEDENGYCTVVGAFSNCTNLREITIPSSVTRMDGSVFRNCTSLTSVVIPSSVTYMGDAFDGCSSLKTVYFQGPECLNTLKTTFKGVTATAYYPANIDEAAWAEAIKKNWGGSIKWVKYNPCAEHSFGEWTRTTEPSCTKAGLETSACANCEVTQTKAVKPLGHTWDAGVVTAPGCLDKGYTTFTCTVCGETKKDNQTEAVGHSWDEGTITTEPTEEKTGVKTITCTVCKETKTETVPKLEHTHKYETAVTLPSCTEKGYTTYTCPCGDTKQDDWVDPTDHKWDEGTVTKEPTADAEGEKTFTCTVCDEHKTEVLPKEVHTHAHAWKSDGEKHWKECACGDKTDEGEHRTVESVECGKQAVCDTCGAAFGEAVAHKYDDVRSDSFSHWHECMACDAIWDKADHTDADGNKTCDVCERTLDGTIGGTYGDATWMLQEAWDGDGWNLYISGSGVMENQTDETGYPWYAYRDEIIEVYVDGVGIGDYAFRNYPNLEWLHAGTDVSTDSPVASIGKEAFSGCGKMWAISFYDKIPTIANDAFTGVTAEVECDEAIDLAVVGDYGGDLAWNAPNITHTYEETVVAPTCEKDGYTLYTCTQCGYDKRGNVTDKIPHSYESGKCTMCGAVDESYVPSDVLYGDANGDGAVNAKDAMLVLQFYTKKITEDKLDLTACDVDGNGTVNAKDAMLILQKYTKKITAFPVEAK